MGRSGRREILGVEFTEAERAMIEAECKRRGWTISELLRVALYQELLFTGNREAYKLIGREVRAKVAERLKEALGLTGQETLKAMSGGVDLTSADLRP